jgi:hypothetical protein
MFKKLQSLFILSRWWIICSTGPYSSLEAAVLLKEEEGGRPIYRDSSNLAPPRSHQSIKKSSEIRSVIFDCRVLIRLFVYDLMLTRLEASCKNSCPLNFVKGQRLNNARIGRGFFFPSVISKKKKKRVGVLGEKLARNVTQTVNGSQLINHEFMRTIAFLRKT